MRLQHYYLINHTKMMYFCKLLTFIAVALSPRICADDIPVVDLASRNHAKIDVNTVSVSGLSSGGFMANLMHYVFSSKVKGGGVFAGGPFNIGYNVTSRDFLPAYAVNFLAAFLGRSQSELQAQTASLSKQRIIDPVTNLRGSKSYVYQGGVDTVNPEFLGLSQKVVNIYKHFGSDVKYLRLPSGTHSVPTDNYGSACHSFNIMDDGLNNCGIESIFEMFAHFYGKDYKKPASSSTPYTGTMYNFDQSPFTPSGNAATDFMNDYGGIYIPSGCENVNATCKLHVAFHGCYQTLFSNFLYDKWAVHGGFFQVADKNNVIVVFPRTAIFAFQSTGTSNFACWDWFGATTTSTIPFKQMPQIKSVANILNAIIRSNVFN